MALSVFLCLRKQAAIWEEALWKSLCGKGLVSLLLGFPGGSAGKKSACNAEDLGSIPGSGRSLGGGNGNPLQYPCLENPMEFLHQEKTPGGLPAMRLQRVGHD